MDRALGAHAGLDDSTGSHHQLPKKENAGLISSQARASSETPSVVTTSRRTSTPSPIMQLAGFPHNWDPARVSAVMQRAGYPSFNWDPNEDASKYYIDDDDPRTSDSEPELLHSAAPPPAPPGPSAACRFASEILGAEILHPRERAMFPEESSSASSAPSSDSWRPAAAPPTAAAPKSSSCQFPPKVIAILEEVWSTTQKPNWAQVCSVQERTGLSPKQIKKWFANRRMRQRAAEGKNDDVTDESSDEGGRTTLPLLKASPETTSPTAVVGPWIGGNPVGIVERLDEREFLATIYVNGKRQKNIFNIGKYGRSLELAKDAAEAWIAAKSNESPGFTKNRHRRVDLGGGAGHYYELELRLGVVMKFSEKWLPAATGLPWHLNKDGFAETTVLVNGKRTPLLCQFIVRSGDMWCPPDNDEATENMLKYFEVVHKNRDKLDNRWSNLRVLPKYEAKYYRKILSALANPDEGVHKDKTNDRWIATWTVDRGWDMKSPNPDTKRKRKKVRMTKSFDVSTHGEEGAKSCAIAARTDALRKLASNMQALMAAYDAHDAKRNEDSAGVWANYNPPVLYGGGRLIEFKRPPGV